MSFKSNEAIEKLDYYLTYDNYNQLTKKQRRDRKYFSHSRKIYKKIHRRWLRNQYKKDNTINLEKCYHGYEY